MIRVIEATPAMFDDLVELESALFREDAATHDPYADPTWPAREGHADLAQLTASPGGIVLAAQLDGQAAGLLVGYVSTSSSTRQPVDYAVLRTLYVAPGSRRSGVADRLIDEFLRWARERGCVEAHVDHYVANEGAQALYEQRGFTARSTSRALAL